MLKEFREFIQRGNVIDLAVAVVLGAAFGAVVTSFVNDILMQILGIFGGTPNFNKLTITINDSVIRYGRFLTALVSFLLIGLGVFLIVQVINRMQRGIRRTEEEIEEEVDEGVELLREIRDLLATGTNGNRN